MCPRFSLKLFLFCIRKVARIFFCSFILSLLFMFVKLLPLHFEMLSDESCCYLQNIKKVDEDEGRKNNYVAVFKVEIQTYFYLPLLVRWRISLKNNSEKNKARQKKKGR